MFNLFKKAFARRMPAAGTFEATVSGDVHTALRGEAVFSVSREKGQEGEADYDLFCLSLQHNGGESNGEHAVIISKCLSEAPPKGRYTIGDAFGFVAQYSHPGASDLGIYYGLAERGKFEITECGPVILAGAFEFSGPGLSMRGEDRPIRLFGAFNAMRVPDASARAFRDR